MAYGMPQYNYPAYGNYNPTQPYAPRVDVNQQAYTGGYSNPNVQMQPPPVTTGVFNSQTPMMNQQPQQSIQMNPLQGLSPSSRVVASKEEAAAVPADFGGAPIIMPVLENGKVSAIYVKQWDIQQGQAVFADFYAIQQPPTQQNLVNNYSNVHMDPGYVSIQDFESLQDAVNTLQNEIEKLKKPNKTGKNSSPVKETTLNE